MIPVDRVGNRAGGKADDTLARNRVRRRRRTRERTKTREDREERRRRSYLSIVQQAEEERQQPGSSAGQVWHEEQDCANIVSKKSGLFKANIKTLLERL